MRRWFPWGSYFSRVRTSSLSSKPLSWWLLFGIGTPIESLNLKYLNPRYGKQSTHAVLTEPSQPFYLSAVVVTGKQVRNGKGSDGTLPQTSDQWPIGRTCNKVLGLLGCFGWRSLLLAQPRETNQCIPTSESVRPVRRVEPFSVSTPANPGLGLNAHLFGVVASAGLRRCCCDV